MSRFGLFPQIVTWGIHHFWMLSLRLLRWLTTVDCKMLSSPHTLCDLEHSLEILSFRFTWLCLIIKLLATRVKFLKTIYLQYCDQLNLCAAFESYMEWNNAQHVSTPTITIQPSTPGTLQLWTALVMWYMCHKLAHTKILQDF